MRLFVFFPALVRLSPSGRVWELCLGLSLMSSLITQMIGQPLAQRSAAVQRAEADLRYSLVRLRIFAEDVALQRGEAAEGAAMTSFFDAVKAATWLTARCSMNLTTFTAAYGLAGGVIPFLILVPYYFHGDITLGMMFQIEGMVGGVRQSLDFFIGAYGDIADWRASAGRLLALETCVLKGPGAALCADAEDVTEDTDDGSSTVASVDPTSMAQRADSSRSYSEEALRVKGVTLATPGGTVLLRDVSFEWRRGDRVTISGPSGSGKTVLLRSLIGAWPPPGSRSSSDGSAGSSGGTPELRQGTLFIASTGFLLPQRATLRRCLAYPEVIAAFDEDLQRALEVCGLGTLIGQLDQEADWGSVLSLDQRQRLVFVRLAARWPTGVRWLVLDEPDTALECPQALQLYGVLEALAPQDVGLVVVSRHPEVARRSGWRHFHIDPSRVTLEEQPTMLTR